MKIRIIATTDLHGSVFPTNYTTVDHNQRFSLAQISSAVKSYRENEHVILVDNGDAFQGTPLVSYAHQNPDKFQNPMALALNAMGYDYINLGNHDFNYGQAIYQKYVDEVSAPLLTSNILKDGQPVGSTQIHTIGNKKIAFIGVVTHYIPHWERPDHISRLTFMDAFNTLQSEVQRVRHDVDYVVGLYHGGLEKDPDSGKPTERLTGENQGYQMLHEIEGLDILITGHQHRSIAKTINGVAVTQTALKASEFASIELNLDTGEALPHLHQTSDYPIDHNLLRLFDGLQEETQQWLDTPLGFIDDASPSLKIEDAFLARIDKHPLVSFINQVQLERSQADIAGFALFNDAIGFDKAISMRDLVSTYLYPNTLVVKELSGKQLKEMVEFSANYFTLNENGDIIVSPEFETPKPQHYNYDMFDGISYSIDVSKPRGSRIQSIKFNDNEIKDADKFKVVMNNYRAAGGGNYTMVLEAPIIEEIQEEMIDTLMNYIKHNSPVKVIHKNNIKILANFFDKK